MEELKLNEPVNEIFRFLNGFWIGIIGLLKFCCLVMVLLASFLCKRLIFISKLLKILQSVNKRPQCCVIRYVFEITADMTVAIEFPRILTL